MDELEQSWKSSRNGDREAEKHRNVVHELEVLTRLWHASGYEEAAVSEERMRLKAFNGQLLGGRSSCIPSFLDEAEHL